MNRIMIIDAFGNCQIKDVNYVANVGESIDWPFWANATVTRKLVYPSEETIAKLKVTKDHRIDVVIFV